MNDPSEELVLLEDGRFAVYQDGVFKGYSLDCTAVNINESMGKDDALSEED